MPSISFFRDLRPSSFGQACQWKKAKPATNLSGSHDWTFLFLLTIKKKKHKQTTKMSLEVQPPFLSPVGFRSTIILVGVYHLPKGTTLFKMVVDFQACWTPKKKMMKMVKYVGRRNVQKTCQRTTSSVYIYIYKYIYIYTSLFHCFIIWRCQVGTLQMNRNPWEMLLAYYLEVPNMSTSWVIPPPLLSGFPHPPHAARILWCSAQVLA